MEGAGSADQSVAERSRLQGHVCFYLWLGLVLFGYDPSRPGLFIIPNIHPQSDQYNIRTTTVVHLWDILPSNFCLYARYLLNFIIQILFSH